MHETFLALGEPNRFAIVELLRTGPQRVTDIGERLQLRQPQVSKHLRVLKQARVVDVEPRAQERLYRLCPETLADMQAWLLRYRRIMDERFAQLDDVLLAMGAAASSPPPPHHKERRRV